MNCVDFLKKYDDKLLLITENKDLLDCLESKKYKFLLVDDLNKVSIDKLEYLFDENDVLVFINDSISPDIFSDYLTTTLLSFFSMRGDVISDCIIYPLNDFPNKKSVGKISDIFLKSLIKSQKTRNILYLGQSGTSGYAKASKGYICDYFLNNNNIKWIPFKFDRSIDDDQYYVDVICKSCIDKSFDYYDTMMLHLTPDIWNKNIKLNKHLDIGEIIGYCTWETDTLPEEWVKCINKVENVYVPSEFNKLTFINSGVTSNIKVVPHVFHGDKLTDKNDVEITDYFGNKIPTDKYTFYCIAEYIERKGINDLIRVFDRISNSNCQLVLKLHWKNYDIRSKYLLIKEIKKITPSIGKNIYLILDNLSHREMTLIHSLGDCYVSLNRGEGFGLTIFDAYNYGKDIVTTKYGGPLDYIKTNDKLVECGIVPVSGMDKFSKLYKSGQMWARPNLDHATELMKISYERYAN